MLVKVFEKNRRHRHSLQSCMLESIVSIFFFLLSSGKASCDNHITVFNNIYLEFIDTHTTCIISCSAQANRMLSTDLMYESGVSMGMKGSDS